MSSYLKPQSPLYHKKEDVYFYPLTTVDQVVMEDGERLNTIFKKTIKENITLLTSGWSETAPYIQTITLTESTDDYNVDADIMYSGDAASDLALNKAASCLTYVKKNHNEITFYCLNNKPEIDIPIEITGTCRNTIADITVKEGTKLNFDIVAYGNEDELLADTPTKNTIGLITDVSIIGYRFSSTEPENITEGEVWISTGTNSNIAFDIIDCVTVYPLFAKQYIGGVFVDVIAKSYQNGEWVDWVTYLYNEGDRCVDITGGWEANASMKLNGGTNKPANVTFNSTNITTKLGSVCIANTVNKINVTPYSTLNFYVDVQETAISDVYGIIANYGDIYKDCVSCLINAQATGLQTISVDISTVEGEYYVVCGSSNRIRVIHKVWLA